MSDASFILRVVVVTLAAILCAVVLVMLWGLFVPAVDNKEIFAIIDLFSKLSSVALWDW